MNDDALRTEASDLLRGIIERVVLIPDPAAPDGLRGELHGAAAEIMALSERVEAMAPEPVRQKTPEDGCPGGGSTVGGCGDRI